tara:strand:- start:14592 stop:14981 length:390 start_codon:yes stop_codon:yes gene_type:complete
MKQKIKLFFVYVILAPSAMNYLFVRTPEWIAKAASHWKNIEQFTSNSEKYSVLPVDVLALKLDMKNKNIQDYRLQSSSLGALYSHRIMEGLYPIQPAANSNFLISSKKMNTKCIVVQKYTDIAIYDCSL